MFFFVANIFTTVVFMYLYQYKRTTQAYDWNRGENTKLGAVKELMTPLQTANL